LINEAGKSLQNSQGAQTGQNVKDLQRQAEQLAQQQREVSKQVASLDSAGGERQQRIQQLSQTKDEMRGKVGEIEQQLNNLSRSHSRTISAMPLASCRKRPAPFATTC
jgi:uncharacterized coiled-coil DUF342 family protein